MARAELMLTATELRAFLEKCRSMAVAVPGLDGWPMVTLAATELDAGELVLRLADDSPVAQALRDGTPATLVADSWPSYDEIRGVIVRGQGRSADAAASPLRFDAHRVTSFDFGKARRPGASQQ